MREAISLLLPVNDDGLCTLSPEETVERFFSTHIKARISDLKHAWFTHEQFMGLMRASMKGGDSVEINFLTDNVNLTAETITCFFEEFGLTSNLLTLGLARHKNTPADVLVHLADLNERFDSEVIPILRVWCARENPNLPADYVNREAARLLQIEFPDFVEESDDLTSRDALCNIFTQPTLGAELIEEAVSREHKPAIYALSMKDSLTAEQERVLHRTALRLGLRSAAEGFALAVYEREVETTFKDWPYEWIEEHLEVSGMNMRGYYDKA